MAARGSRRFLSSVAACRGGHGCFSGTRAAGSATPAALSKPIGTLLGETGCGAASRFEVVAGAVSRAAGDSSAGTIDAGLAAGSGTEFSVLAAVFSNTACVGACNPFDSFAAGSAEPPGDCWTGDSDDSLTRNAGDSVAIV